MSAPPPFDPKLCANRRLPVSCTHNGQVTPPCLIVPSRSPLGFRFCIQTVDCTSNILYLRRRLARANCRAQKFAVACRQRRTNKRHFCATAGPFALNCTRPKVGNGRRTVESSGRIGQVPSRLFLIHLRHFRTSSARCCPYLGIYSRMTLLSRTGIGFKSLAKASAPTAKCFEWDGTAPSKWVNYEGSGVNGSAQSFVAALSERTAGVEILRNVGLSQLAKSAMKSRRADRSSDCRLAFRDSSENV